MTPPDEPSPTATSSARRPTGPLDGVVVVDCTRVLAGPFATMILADLGARIIKVERVGVGDDSRGFGPFVGERSAYFAAVNAGKESIALDLADPADRQVFEGLLGIADVLVENFRPGAMERLGYGWDAVHARFPGLVYAAVSGFGQTGPYAHRPAYDMVVQGMGGVMSVTGEEGGDPVRVGVSVGDMTAGLFLVSGVTAALYRRRETGEGMLVDVGMLDCQVAILENAISRYTVEGAVPGPIGSRHPFIAPFAALRTGDGRLVVAVGTDAFFVDLCSVLGAPDLADDPRFATNRDRAANVGALHEELERRLTTRGTAEWLADLEAAGIPCGPVNDVAAVLADPHVQARDMVLPVDDPALPMLRLAGNPIKLSGYPAPTVRPAAPALDGDRAALLAELGLNDR